MMAQDEKIEMMKRAMGLLDQAGSLLIEATRHHYQASYNAYPYDLIDKNGNHIEIDLGDLGNKPICVELMLPGRKARQDAEKIRQVLC